MVLGALVDVVEVLVVVPLGQIVVVVVVAVGSVVLVVVAVVVVDVVVESGATRSGDSAQQPAEPPVTVVLLSPGPFTGDDAVESAAPATLTASSVVSAIPATATVDSRSERPRIQLSSPPARPGCAGDAVSCEPSRRVRAAQDTAPRVTATIRNSERSVTVSGLDRRDLGEQVHDGHSREIHSPLTCRWRVGKLAGVRCERGRTYGSSTQDRRSRVGCRVPGLSWPRCSGRRRSRKSAAHL